MVTKTNGFLEEYHEKCSSGQIIVGQEMMTCLDSLIRDMSNPRYVYDTTSADLRIGFIEGCVRLTKSPFYGKPMTLMLFQKAFISALFGFKMAETGYDRFKKTIFLIARKNGKSELCSALALTEMILGNSGSDIVCSSNDDTQASILYDAVDTMRQMIDPMNQDTWRNQRCIKCLINNSKIFKISDRTRNKEGRNIDFAFQDESHELRTNAIPKAIEQSQSLKDNPKFINLTTEGFVNDGYLDEELRRARAVLNGEDDGPAAERLLPWLYTQDSEAEVWQDELSWYKSNPTLGVVKKWDYLREQIDLARKSKADRVYVLSKDFNIKQSNSQAWLTEEDYSYDAKFDISDFKGGLCLGAVDLAETTDLTAAKILLMRRGDKTKYVYSHYFIPESKLRKSDDRNAGAKYAEWSRDGHVTICEGNEVDLTLVADWFYSLYRDYGIRLMMCGYDQKFAKNFLNRMGDYGFDTEVVWQNKLTLSNAMKLCEADLKDRLVNYNNNPVDRWCLGNASMEIDGFGNVMAVKINNQQERRIDGAVTLIILYEIYRRYRSSYEDRLRVE